MLNRPYVLKHFKRILFVVSLLVTILAGVLIGIILVYQKGFPQIENLEDIKTNEMSIIYDDLGKPIKAFSVERRIIVQRWDIPEILEKALVASEDNQFYTHWGINFKGTLRAIVGVLTGQNLGGGSSITQQLARNYYLSNERTFSRKFREILMSIQLEKKYTKDQILTAYCNKINLGYGVYGVEAAARYYFGKSIKEVSIAEAALIPAIMPSPNNIYDVFKNPQRCLEKRNAILKKMRNMQFITETQYYEAIETPLPKIPHEFDRDEIGDYFVEEVRQRLALKFGDQRLYTGGLEIFSTLNTQLQKWAEISLQEGLNALDKQRGWRGPLWNVIRQQRVHLEDLPMVRLPEWVQLSLAPGEIVAGLVLRVEPHQAILKIARSRALLDEKEVLWTGFPLTSILKCGDVILVKIKEIPANSNSPLIVSLEQEPNLESALLVIENKTGEIKALVGGYSFQRTQMNHALHVMRQPGSLCAPFIYSAAMEYGYSPASVLEDAPITFENRWTNSAYAPWNTSGHFVGPITLRQAFEQSREVISAKIVDVLTPPVIIQQTKRFGITTQLKPSFYAALGAFDTTLKDMLAAYTVFPNLGVRVNPYFIRRVLDQDGYTLAENYPDKKKVLEEETAYLLNYLMQGVVQEGVNMPAHRFDAPIGGKSGVSDDYSDAWFIGFSPSITVGVWVGFESKKSLGSYELAAKAAAPIFVAFMEKYLEHYHEPHQFRRPAGINMIEIDKKTGKLLSPDCLYPFSEAFVRGTEPVDFCNIEEHQLFPQYTPTRDTNKNQ